ncbi:F-box/kelch-repeat protein At3g61590-like [Punica granatum]|uniref:F-box domain-containing protein n=2 Tax=Punica granatum TaxID=22663 RepID=A0A218XG30_PUNGR|nr:F-box/kelch-repeat protein At3g61590-like [Punica granatum]OWM83676.1 hypothetical protein CDL15_Pgr004106 [Punica granatum]PKI51353.1 hypothetical protein CRG98_028214 [Punica granatum]
MDSGGSWDDTDDIQDGGTHSCSEVDADDEGMQEEYPVSLDLMPNDTLERILSFLPIESIYKAESVCKRWQTIVRSRNFIRNIYPVHHQLPWYYMFKCTNKHTGHAYDPNLRKWNRISLPNCTESSDLIIGTSGGLVSFYDIDVRTGKLYVGNPLTRQWRELIEPPGLNLPEYGALSMTRSRKSSSEGGSYRISIVESKHVSVNFLEWNLSIHLYDSESKTWRTPLREVLTGWRGGNESAICDGSLYFLMYAAGGGWNMQYQHGLARYSLSGQSLGHDSLARSFIPAPCTLTCGRLMNHGERLVMVGGIGKEGRPGRLKGIGIWVLNGSKWDEIAMMPQEYFERFGGSDDVFACSGSCGLVYIHRYGRSALLMFDMNERRWRWAQKGPVVALKFSLDVFSGFCFKPRLDAMP